MSPTPSDTINAFLSSVPKDVLSRFPDTVAHMEKQGVKQQARLDAIAAQLNFDAMLLPAITTTDLSSPQSIAALNDLLKAATHTGAFVGTPASHDALAPKVAAFLKNPNTHDIPAAQAALPENPGLSELVALYKEDLLSEIQILQKDFPKPGTPYFSSSCFKMSMYTSAFVSIHTWSNPSGIASIWGVGPGNQAVNVMMSLMSSATSTYPKSIGATDLPSLVQKITQEKHRRAKQHALSALTDLSPEDIARAVELLQKDKGILGTPPTAKRPPGPR